MRGTSGRKKFGSSGAFQFPSDVVLPLDVQAVYSYNAGMSDSKRRQRGARPRRSRAAAEVVQYTIRSVPREVDAALRKRATKRGTSLNDVLLEVLKDGAGMASAPQTHHDLDHLAGSMRPDPKLDRIFEEMRQIDEEMWR